MNLTLRFPYTCFDLIISDGYRRHLLFALGRSRWNRRNRQEGRRSVYPRTSRQKISKCFADAHLIELLQMLFCEVRMRLGSEVHLPAVKRNWLWSTRRGVRRQVRKEDRKTGVWWWTIGVRGWWWTGRPVCIGTRWIHPPHGGWLSESRCLTRSLLSLLSLLLFSLLLLLLFTTSVLIFVLASSPLPNKWRTRKRTFLLLPAPPTRWWWCNPRSDERCTAKRGS